MVAVAAWGFFLLYVLLAYDPRLWAVVDNRTGETVQVHGVRVINGRMDGQKSSTGLVLVPARTAREVPLFYEGDADRVTGGRVGILIGRVHGTPREWTPLTVKQMLDLRDKKGSLVVEKDGAGARLVYLAGEAHAPRLRP